MGKANQTASWSCYKGFQTSLYQNNCRKEGTLQSFHYKIVHKGRNRSLHPMLWIGSQNRCTFEGHEVNNFNESAKP